MTKLGLLIAAVAVLAFMSIAKTMESRFATAPTIAFAENDVYQTIGRGLYAGRLWIPEPVRRAICDMKTKVFQKLAQFIRWIRHEATRYYIYRVAECVAARVRAGDEDWRVCLEAAKQVDRGPAFVVASHL